MAKMTGLGLNVYVNGMNISGDVGSIQKISGGPKAGLVTGVDKSAPERMGLYRDGAISVSTWFNKATAAAFQTLKPLPTADVVASVGIGTTLGDEGVAIVAKQANYDPQRDKDGNLTLGADFLANGFGIEWGTQLTAGIRSDTAATNGTSFDLGSASPGAFGLQAYLHVFSFTGSSCTVKIQESSDNGSGDAFADVAGASFNAGGSGFGARTATAAINVERYLRVVTTGTFSQCSFAVLGIRNSTSVVF